MDCLSRFERVTSGMIRKNISRRRTSTGSWTCQLLDDLKFEKIQKFFRCTAKS
jgi:hypothetical protein